MNGKTVWLLEAKWQGKECKGCSLPLVIPQGRNWDNKYSIVPSLWFPARDSHWLKPVEAGEQGSPLMNKCFQFSLLKNARWWERRQKSKFEGAPEDIQGGSWRRMCLRWLTKSPSIALTMVRLPNYTVNKIVFIKILLNFHSKVPFTINLSSLIFHQ